MRRRISKRVRMWDASTTDPQEAAPNVDRATVREEGGEGCQTSSDTGGLQLSQTHRPSSMVGLYLTSGFTKGRYGFLRPHCARLRNHGADLMLGNCGGLFEW